MSRTMPFTANVDKHLRPSLMRVVIGQTRGLDKHPSMRSTKLKTQERACLFSIAGHGHESHRRPVFAVGLTPACEIDRPR